LQLTKQLLERDNKVVVGVRSTKSEDLLNLQKQHDGKLSILKMDAASADSVHNWVANAAKELKVVDVRTLPPWCSVIQMRVVALQSIEPFGPFFVGVMIALNSLSNVGVSIRCGERL
jgi:NAD(P)-dependent dehydrogenase (short-subunit alcohol dehydrogenase family)